MALALLVAVVVTVSGAERPRRARLVAAGLLLLAGCGGGAPQVAQLPPPEVGVSALVQRDVPEFFETTGRTAAIDSVDVRARVAGYLVKVNFKDGDLVKAGDSLFEIDPRPYQAQEVQVEGELARWEAQRTAAWPPPAPRARRSSTPRSRPRPRPTPRSSPPRAASIKRSWTSSSRPSRHRWRDA